MLLDALGVGIACVTNDFMDAAHGCNIGCNPAADARALNHFRANGTHSHLSWLSASSPVVDSTCGAINRIALQEAMSRMDQPGSFGPTAFSSTSSGSALRAAAVDGQASSSSSMAGEAIPVLHASGDNSPFHGSTRTMSGHAHDQHLPPCGQTKEQVFQRLRTAISPRYQWPLRWGFKNPHTTYYVNILKQLFPCMVYVNTVRDLDAMVRGLSHFENRVHEATGFGFFDATEAARVRSSLVTRQHFYAGYIKRVNTELDSWLSQCLPSQFVHVALQRLVVRGTLLVLPPPADETDEVVAPHDVGESRLQILGSATMADQALVAANTSTKLPTSIHMHIASRLRSACFQETVRPLLHVLGLENDATAWNATHRFLLASLPTVLQSVATQSARPLLLPQSDSSFSWPHTMQPHACRGTLNGRLSTRTRVDVRSSSS